MRQGNVEWMDQQFVRVSRSLIEDYQSFFPCYEILGSDVHSCPFALPLFIIAACNHSSYKIDVKEFDRLSTSPRSLT